MHGYMKHPVTNYDPDDQQIHFFLDRRVRTPVIYMVVLGLTVAVILTLPFIAVPVTVQNRGIIRPVTEVAEIRVIPSARVAVVNIFEGQRVKQGDTMLMLESEGLERRIELARLELERICNYIADLQSLSHEANRENFHTELYRTQHEDFKNKLVEIDLRLERANRQVGRQRPLIEQRLIAEKDYEEELFLRNQLENEKKITKAAQMARWRSELATWSSERDRYLSTMTQLERQRDLYVIRSPVTGTVESFDGIYPDCNLQAGQVVAVISPENSLIAEVFVPAKHIGMLFMGMPVRIQVDAFDYNRWGMVPGKITGMSDDYHLVDNVPVFKVKCALDIPSLRLKNGTTGFLRKGMTVNARFIIAESTILQLLYLKTDDWLNPGRNNANGYP